MRTVELVCTGVGTRHPRPQRLALLRVGDEQPLPPDLRLTEHLEFNRRGSIVASAAPQYRARNLKRMFVQAPVTAEFAAERDRYQHLLRGANWSTESWLFTHTPGCRLSKPIRDNRLNAILLEALRVGEQRLDLSKLDLH